MQTVFVICAVFGVTVLLVQVAMLLLGLVGDFAGAESLDGAGADGDTGSLDSLESGEPDSVGEDKSKLPDPGDLDQVAQPESGVVQKVVRYLSFQSVVAFLAFFGLGGLAAAREGLSLPWQSAVGFGAGAASMVLLGYAFRLLRGLERDGTVRSSDLAGVRGRVYLRVPPEGSGLGRVTLSAAGRTVERRARTPGPMLPTGVAVRVRRVLDSQTVEVEPVGGPPPTPTQAAQAR